MRSAPSLFLFLEVSSKDLAKSRYSPKSVSVAKKAECDSYVSGQVRQVWMLDLNCILHFISPVKLKPCKNCIPLVWVNSRLMLLK